MALLKNQQENARWQLGWLCWVDNAHLKDAGQTIKHFPAVFNVPFLSQRTICLYSWLHPCLAHWTNENKV